MVGCIERMERGGLGVWAEEAEMRLRWWRKCQRSLSNPSLRMSRMEGQGEEKRWKEGFNEENKKKEDGQSS